MRITEKDLAELIKTNPDFIEEGLILVGEEITCGPVGRLDALWKDKDGIYVVVEYKKYRASDSVLGQIARYIAWVKQEYHVPRVRGIILCQQATEKLLFASTINSDISIKEFGSVKQPERIALQLEIDDQSGELPLSEASILLRRLGELFKQHATENEDDYQHDTMYPFEIINHEKPSKLPWNGTYHILESLAQIFDVSNAFTSSWKRNGVPNLLYAVRTTLRNIAGKEDGSIPWRATSDLIDNLGNIVEDWNTQSILHTIVVIIYEALLILEKHWENLKKTESPITIGKGLQYGKALFNKIIDLCLMLRE